MDHRHTGASPSPTADRHTVLVVDDEPSIVDAVATSLRYEGFDVEEATTGRAALAAAQERPPDLIVLDVMLPDLDGLEVTRRLRRDGIHSPVLFLTARDALEDKVAGLTVGGDDYVTKPFALAEIIARARAILRRTGADPGGDHGLLHFSDLEMDEGAHEVRRGGQPIKLTATEFNLLRFFLRNPRQVVSKAQILDNVWHYDFGGEANVVETYVSYLRREARASRTAAHPHHPAGGLHTPRVRRGVGVPADAVVARRGRHGARGSRERRRRHVPGTAILPLRPYRPVPESSHMPIEAALGSHPGPAGGPSGTGRGQGDGAPGGVPSAGGGEPSSTTAPGQPCTPFLGLDADSLDGLTPGTFIEVRSASGAVAYRCSLPVFGQAALTPQLPSRITGFAQNSVDAYEPTAYFTVPATTSDGAAFRVRASVLGGGPESGGQLILAEPVGSAASTLDRLLHVELIVTAGALLAAALLGWWLVRVGLRPLAAVERTAGAIARGELDQRVPGESSSTEVGRLARTLNTMLGRIETAFAQRDATEAELRGSEARMRQFVADASHELRTPLAAVSAYAELFGQGASAHAEDLKRVMDGIRSETARMGHLVEDLVLLARLDEGRPLAHEDVELVALAADAVCAPPPRWGRSGPSRSWPTTPWRSSGTLSPAPGRRQPPGQRPLPHAPEDRRRGQRGPGGRRGDRPGLRRRPRARRRASDEGVERFYRADASRSRQHGGAGLGLSIVASITKAHRGTVSVAPGASGGAEFTVHLPLAEPEPSPAAP